MRIAVIGASGFVGRHLLRAAKDRGIEVVGIVRSEASSRKILETGGRPAVVPSLDGPSLSEALAGVEAVVHLAQISAEREGLSYEGINVGGTRNVVAASRAQGVRRIVYFSGLGVARYGISRRSTNGYFLSKLASEVEVFRSGVGASVFRPSYIVGRGDAFLAPLRAAFASGEVEIVGDGNYRLQPVAIRDACEAILNSLTLEGPRVFDLVGPEPLSYNSFVSRVADAVRRTGSAADYRVVRVPISEAEVRASHGGYRGWVEDELDVLLCDEVSDPEPLKALLGRSLMPLEEALASALGS